MQAGIQGLAVRRAAGFCLLPRLTALSTELSALARAKPLVAAPAGVVRSASLILREVRGLTGDRSIRPPRRSDAPTFSELSVALAGARASLEAHLAAFENTKRSESPEMRALKARIANRMNELFPEGPEGKRVLGPGSRAGTAQTTNVPPRT